MVFFFTCKNCSGIVLWIVRAVAFSRKLVVHPIFFMLDADALRCLARLVGLRRVVGGCDRRCGRVGSAFGVEAVGATHEQVGRAGDCQNSDVVLTFILNEEKDKIF